MNTNSNKLNSNLPSDLQGRGIPRQRSRCHFQVVHAWSRRRATLTTVMLPTILGSLLVAGTLRARSSELPQMRRPNILVILTDDQGFGDVSALNPDAKFETPNMDRLAREGIAMTNAHSADSVCTPSRYALLTGRYCWRTQLKRGVLGAEATCLIPDDRMTIASMLRQAGYRSAMIGKWHLGMDFPGEAGSRDWSKPVLDMPLDKGFDFFFGIPASLNYGVLAWFEGRHAKVPPTLFTNKKPNPRHSDYRIMPPYDDTAAATRQRLRRPGMEVAADFVDQNCLTRFTDEAIDWLKDHQSKDDGRPFFLYLPLTSPHYPVCPLPAFQGRGDAGAYGEFVIETDHHVGRILETLDQMGVSENTLVVLTSDNGPENSWKARRREFNHDSRGGFREGKRSVYEGGHRVPFLLRWPAGIERPGRTFDGLIGQVDLMATFAELTQTQLPTNAAEDSHSFFAALQSTDLQSKKLRLNKPGPKRPPLINHGNDGRYAITQGRWKLILPSKKTEAELFDLKMDPSESVNLAAKDPTRVAEMTEQINRIITHGRSTPGPKQSNDTGHWPDLFWMTADQF